MEIVEIEFNIDDMTPELLSYAEDKIFENGALDVVIIPCLMKKSRSGYSIKVICKEEDLGKILETIFKETTTIGLRYSKKNRVELERESKKIEFEIDGNIHSCSVKLSYYKGKLVNVKPEFEDLVACAKKSGLPVKTIDQIVRTNINSM